jgi:hypothetical protein
MGQRGERKLVDRPDPKPSGASKIHPGDLAGGKALSDKARAVEQSGAKPPPRKARSRSKVPSSMYQDPQMLHLQREVEAKAKKPERERLPPLKGPMPKPGVGLLEDNTKRAAELGEKVRMKRAVDALREKNDRDLAASGLSVQKPRPDPTKDLMRRSTPEEIMARTPEEHRARIDAMKAEAARLRNKAAVTRDATKEVKRIGQAARGQRKVDEYFADQRAKGNVVDSKPQPGPRKARSRSRVPESMLQDPQMLHLQREAETKKPSVGERIRGLFKKAGGYDATGYGTLAPEEKALLNKANRQTMTGARQGSAIARALDPQLASMYGKDTSAGRSNRQQLAKEHRARRLRRWALH